METVYYPLRINSSLKLLQGSGHCFEPQNIEQEILNDEGKNTSFDACLIKP
jgi:hypothetical protein